MGKKNAVRIGVFIPTECQLLDAACVDIFRHHFTRIHVAGRDSVPQAVIDLAPSMNTRYISGGPARITASTASSENGADTASSRVIPLTSGMNILQTHHYAEAAVAPGQLDIVRVPGPDPRTSAFEAGAIATGYGDQGEGRDDGYPVRLHGHLRSRRGGPTQGQDSVRAAAGCRTRFATGSGPTSS
ncbi:hypothetical protein PG985_015163 [Apiospora marii]|uniref:uncharacterized protein n=1 Tax=Apiospora marii TaxID=335849 RepID=UPI00312D90D0